MTRTRKRKSSKNIVYSKEELNSGDGMLTSVWGPSLWHYLHTMSFNYPTHPTAEQKKQYKSFIMNLKHVLPCKYCRMNLKNNLRELPVTPKVLENRASFSRYMYDLHEHINTMLGKKSGLSFEDVQQRYENFRSRCTLDLTNAKRKVNKLLGGKVKRKNKTKKNKKKKENGCTEPLYGKKSKCLIRIVPQDTKTDTFEMSSKCYKKRGNQD